MKNIFFTIITGALLFASLNVLAQIPKTFAQIKVTSGVFNGNDVSNKLKDVYVGFYLDNSGKLGMIQINKSTLGNGYGRLDPIVIEKEFVKATSSNVEHFYFNWDYSSTKKEGKVTHGHAIVVVSKIHSATGVGYKVKKMDGQNRQILSVSGLVNGKDLLAKQLAKQF